MCDTRGCCTVCLVRVPQAGVYLCAKPTATEKEGCRRREEGLAEQHQEEVCLGYPNTLLVITPPGSRRYITFNVCYALCVTLSDHVRTCDSICFFHSAAGYDIGSYSRRQTFWFVSMWLDVVADILWQIRRLRPSTTSTINTHHHSNCTKSTTATTPAIPNNESSSTSVRRDIGTAATAT